MFTPQEYQKIHRCVGWVNSIAKTRSFTWNIRKEQETGLKQ
jgi:hypothetical protein